MKEDLHRVIEKLLEDSIRNIAIIGDFFVDEYLYGKNRGISSSSLLPIFKDDKKTLSPGGAGNVANNLFGLNCNLYIATVMGQDNYGDYIYDYFLKRKVNIEGVMRSDSNSNVKRRFIGSNIEIFRQDEIGLIFNKESFKNFIEEWISKVVSKIDVLIFSDYNLGICTEEICKYVIDICNEYSVKILVNSRSNNWRKYSNIDYIVPNLEEFKNVIKFLYNDSYSPELELHFARNLIKEYNIKNIIITKGNEGLRLINKKEDILNKALNISVVDVIGAGDTVLGALGALISLELSHESITFLINIAGAMSVEVKGTYAIRKEAFLDKVFSLINEVYKNKILNLKELCGIMNAYKRLNKKVVFTNGCFDLIHLGHIEYLYQAKKLGDKLIVAINSDYSVKLNKGKNRPIKDENDRALTIGALSFVDHIIIFNDKTPKKIIKAIEPDYLVKGGDYAINDLEGREYAKEVIILDYLNGKSTSKLVEKIIKEKSNKENQEKEN